MSHNSLLSSLLVTLPYWVAAITVETNNGIIAAVVGKFSSIKHSIDTTCLGFKLVKILFDFDRLINKQMNGFLTHQQVSHYLSASCSLMSDSLQLCGLYSPWNSPGQKAGVGSHSLLQGLFPTQGSNPGLPHCRWILYHLSYQGSQLHYVDLSKH